MKKYIGILLVDDNELTRYGLRHMLEQEEDMEVVGDCANAEEALSQVRMLLPDIVLMDIKMPGMNGIEATRHLKRNGLNYDGDVIILAESVDHRSEAVEAGAAGYLLKEDIKGAELAQTIRQAYRNKYSLKEYPGPFEEIELVVPPPVDAAQLLRFVCQVEEILTDGCGSIQQMVGSWEGGTVITVSLGLDKNPLANLLEKLEDMPEVEKIDEKPMARDDFSSSPNKFKTLPRQRTSFMEGIRITLKQLSMADQELVVVLN